MRVQRLKSQDLNMIDTIEIAKRQARKYICTNYRRRNSVMNDLPDAILLPALAID